MPLEMKWWHWVVAGASCAAILAFLWFNFGREMEVLPRVDPQVGIQTPGFVTEEEQREAEMMQELIRRKNDPHSENPHP